MRRHTRLGLVPLAIPLLPLLFLLSGCRVVGAIFKAGVGVVIFIAVVVVAIVGGLAMLLGRRSN